MLMKEVSDGLACWASVLSFENLSFKELGLEPAAASLTEWLAKGFYPELWQQADLNRETFYATSVASYPERDLRQILTVQSLQGFKRFLRARAVRSGQMVNMAELGRDQGIKAQTAKDWVGVLETSVENIGKRLVKALKLYLNAPGIFIVLLWSGPSSLLNSRLVGAVSETFVFAGFRKVATPSLAQEIQCGLRELCSVLGSMENSWQGSRLFPFTASHPAA